MSDGEIHSRYGGSIASRWLACPGSVALCDTVPPEKSSSYAEEGTAAHKLAEHCLRQGYRYANICLDGKEVDVGQPITTDMVNAVNEYLEAVNAELGRAWLDVRQALGENSDPAMHPVLFVEESFELPLKTAAPGEVFGKNDAMVWWPRTGRLSVWDYKHGAGVYVSVEDSKQLKFYGLGAVLSKKLPVQEIELYIVQPRLQGAEAVRSWVMPYAELVEFLGELEDGVALAKIADSVLKGGDFHSDPKFADLYLETGDHCRWCPAAAVCPAREQQALDAAAGAFTSFVDVTADTLPKLEEQSLERLGQLLKGIETISDWGGQIREYIFKRLNEGEPVPGWKLVEKIGRRKWASDDQVISGYLQLAYGLDEEDVRPRKLATLTQVETLLKAAITDKKERLDAKADIEHRFTVKESSGLTMVPEHSGRQGVTVAGEADFSSVSIPDA